MAPGVARAPGGNPGRRLSGGATDGALDAQEVDVPSHDEQRVRNTHYNRITCNERGCPGNVRHVDGAKRHIRRHTRRNACGPVAIPLDRVRSGGYFPWTGCGPVAISPGQGAAPGLAWAAPAPTGWPAGGLACRRSSALADPAERWLGSGWPRRLMLAVAPGAARAILVVTLPAGNADHAGLLCGSAAAKSAGSPHGTGRLPAERLTGAMVLPCQVPAGSRPGERHVSEPQAAFARRMRRRRSADRSSSFRPPQVPYFSGRDTA